MKERIVYLGPFNNNQQNKLIDKAVEKLKKNKGEEFYYLLPNGELLKQYRQSFINRVESTFEINVFTFDDIVNKTLKNESIQIIDNPIKNFVIGKVLEILSQQGQLVYYDKLINTKGFVHSLNDIIGEIKRSLVYPQDYLNNCPNKRSFKEIGIIYKEYERILMEFGLQDREGMYFKSIEILRNDNFLKDLKFIIIDEFYDFRPIELAILKELIDHDLDIYINIPFDMEKRPQILNTTLEILKDLGFIIEYVKKDNKSLFEEVSFKLFSESKDLYLPKEEIQIINAPTAYLELKRIFEEIKRKYIEGIQLKDMGVILSNPEYLSSLFRVSKEEKVPLSIDKSIGLHYLTLTREILGILENRISNGNKSKLINRIKFRYFNIFEENQKDIYELILRKQNFNDIKELKLLFEEAGELSISQDNLENLQEIINVVDKEMQSIPKSDTVKNYNKYILKQFEDFHVVEKILEIYKDTKDEKLFLRDLSGINKIKEVLLIIESSPLLEEKVSLEEYYLILEEHIEEETIVEEPGNLEGVHILNPVNSRGILKDTIFITGLSQGAYPVLENSNYFINEDNLKSIKTMGINAKSYVENLNNEILKFSSMIATCESKLYLSYNRGNTDISLPSMFLDELLGLFVKNEDGNSLEEIYIELEYLIKKDIKSISNKKDLTKYLLHKYYNEETLDFNNCKIYEDEFYKLFSQINNKIQGEIYRNGDEFNEYMGVLKYENAIKDIRQNVNDVFSISYLEGYSMCPYSFLLKNIFKLESMDRDLEEYNPIDIGTIYHESLRHYYQKYLIDIHKYVIGAKEFNIEDSLEYLKEIVCGYAAQFGFNIQFKRHLLIIQNIILKLSDFIKEDLKRLVKWKLLPYEFEVDFGKKQQFIIGDKEIRIPMVGRIDRIDKFIEEDKYVVIDYKSSTYGIRDVRDMRTGLSLQLPVYILSQKDKEVLAGAYGIISNGALEIKIGLVNETSIITRRSMGGLEREEWDELMEMTHINILNIIKGINRGDFSVRPLECSSYCIYKDICRYEDILEVEE